jgi:signal transduction histidine kinase
MVLSQVPLAASIALVVVVAALWHPGIAADPGFRLAVLLQACVLVLAAVVPWERLPPGLALAVPLLDFAPVALVRVAGLGTGMQLGVLAAIPVVWLAWSGLHPRFCLAMTFLGPLLTVWVPLAAAGNITLSAYADVLVLPAMMFATGAVVHMLAVSSADQQRSLEEARDELQRTLEASAREKRLLDAVLETVPVGVQAIDAEGRTSVTNHQQYLNKALAGRVPGANQDWPGIFDTGGHPLAPQEQPVMRAVRGEAFSDYVIRLGEGQAQRVFSTSARPIRSPGGGADGAVLAFTDVTALVQALASKDDFLSNVSHELRTPLTSVLGYIDLLRNAPDLPLHIRQGLTVVRRNAERLQRLVTDLLTAASGGIDVQPAPADVAEIVRFAVATAAPAADSAGLDLHDGTEERTLPAVVDAVRIAQLLDNLISNAVKYTLRGGSIIVRAARTSGGVELTVSDTGIGMSESEASAIFDRFYRAEAAREAHIPGIGLGLAIVKAIVEAHSGRIECASRPAAGTTFTVFLPDPAAEAGRRPPEEAFVPVREAGRYKEDHRG